VRIGLLSDTHIPEVQRELPLELTEAFRGVDLILHAGDIYLPSVLDELERIAPVLAASGDDDFGGVLDDERVKEKHVLQFQGQTLWLMHQRPEYLMSQCWPGRHVLKEGQENPDIVICGHEHRTDVQQVDGTLFINPGSPTFLSYLRGLGTIGILDINSGEADIHIVRL